MIFKQHYARAIRDLLRYKHLAFRFGNRAVVRVDMIHAAVRTLYASDGSTAMCSCLSGNECRDVSVTLAHLSKGPMNLRDWIPFTTAQNSLPLQPILLQLLQEQYVVYLCKPAQFPVVAVSTGATDGKAVPNVYPSNGSALFNSDVVSTHTPAFRAKTHVEAAFALVLYNVFDVFWPFLRSGATVWRAFVDSL